VGANFSHRGYNMCANLLRTTFADAGIQVRLNPDAVFEFPYGDGYWSSCSIAPITTRTSSSYCSRTRRRDYTLLDCGANYGYWSVLV